jgi:hypothetical protein
MVDGVRVYVEAAKAKRFKPAHTWVEMPIPALATVDPDMGGTADFVTYSPKARHLIVLDFKYGAGVYVEVVENTQEKVYALGVLLTVLALGHKVDTVELGVVQPRFEGAEPVRTWTFRSGELIDFMSDRRDAAAKTRLVDAPLAAGSHCKFCPAAGLPCPELDARTTALMAQKFDAALPQQVNLDALAVALQQAPQVKAQLKALDELAYQLAIRGVEIPGHKLVNKIARRQYKDEAAVLEWAKAQAIDPYAEPAVLSPAQLEKRIAESLPRGKKKEAAEILKPLTESVSSGTVLVPVADSRPAVAAGIGAADYEVIDAPSEPKRLTSVKEMF